MLVFTRKIDQCVVIGDNIQVRVLAARKDRVVLGFACPPEVPVHREEVYRRIRGNNKKRDCVGVR